MIPGRTSFVNWVDKIRMLLSRHAAAVDEVQHRKLHGQLLKCSTSHWYWLLVCSTSLFWHHHARCHWNACYSCAGASYVQRSCTATQQTWLVRRVLAASIGYVSICYWHMATRLLSRNFKRLSRLVVICLITLQLSHCVRVEVCSGRLNSLQIIPKCAHVRTLNNQR